MKMNDYRFYPQQPLHPRNTKRERIPRIFREVNVRKGKYLQFFPCIRSARERGKRLDILVILLVIAGWY